MKVLYIGLYNEGSTAKMRGKYLKELLPTADFSVIDTSIVLENTNRIFRSIGWRWKIGPFIHSINSYIIHNLSHKFYDLIWIDKGVFIKPSVVQILKNRCNQMVHYTPDPAFAYHRSKLFFEALPLYDYCITTKQFEKENYEQYGVKTIVCTQGYDPLLHKPYHSFKEKKGVVFIGHHEDEREAIISKLIEADVHIILAGIKWNRLVRRYKHKANFAYKGTRVLGEDYAKLISSAQLGLGLLSKWIPEKHTTRTFEIPACGTALLTEKNNETSSFFHEDEVLFYDGKNDITGLVKHYLSNPELLQSVTTRGTLRVAESNRDYKSIMRSLLNQMEITR
jgi:spore maturation protein CgeB